MAKQQHESGDRKAREGWNYRSDRVSSQRWTEWKWRRTGKEWNFYTTLNNLRIIRENCVGWTVCVFHQRVDKFQGSCRDFWDLIRLSRSRGPEIPSKLLRNRLLLERVTEYLIPGGLGTVRIRCIPTSEGKGTTVFPKHPSTTFAEINLRACFLHCVTTFCKVFRAPFLGGKLNAWM